MPFILAQHELKYVIVKCQENFGHATSKVMPEDHSWLTIYYVWAQVFFFLSRRNYRCPIVVSLMGEQNFSFPMGVNVLAGI